MSDVDLSADRRGTVIGVAVFLALLDITSVSLRFLSRKVSKAGYWYDDWFCLFAGIFTLGFNAVGGELAHVGLGRHAAALPDHGRAYAKQVHFVMILYTFGIAFYKYALLLLYVRIFPMIWLRRLATVFAITITIWLFTIVFLVLFQCHPINRAWDSSVDGECLNLTSINIAQSVPTIVFDVILMILPVVLVWRVQMPKISKLSVAAMFLLCGMVTIVSTVRLVYIIRQQFADLTWDFTSLAQWSSAEPSIGLLSASIPLFGVLGKKIRRRIFGETSGSSYWARMGSDRPTTVDFTRMGTDRSKHSHREPDEIELTNHFDEETLPKHQSSDTLQREKSRDGVVTHTEFA